jgi:hypothetical protein
VEFLAGTLVRDAKEAFEGKEQRHSVCPSRLAILAGISKNRWSMTRILLRGLVTLGLVIVASVIWVVSGRYISLLLDRVKTVSMESLPAAPLSYDGTERGGTFQIGELELRTEGPDNEPFPMPIQFDSRGRPVLTGPEKSFLLVFEPGDQVSFMVKRGLMSWPALFDFNFMTGSSPSWKRHLYYVLRWNKPSGSELTMVWRYEQHFNQVWTSGFMTRAGTTGLIQAELSR